MADDPIVAENVSSETSLEDKPSPAPQLTEEQEARITQLVQEKVDLATRTATESARREIQSVKDKARREVEDLQSRERLAQTRLTGVQSSLGDIDPEVRDRINNADLRAQNQILRQEEDRRARMQQQEQFDTSFKGSIAQHISGLGLDPSDSRIDWAEDTTGDYLAKQQRILASVAKIQTEERKKQTPDVEQLTRDIEASVRKSMGLDSPTVDTPAVMKKSFKEMSPEEKIMQGLKSPSK